MPFENLTIHERYLFRYIVALAKCVIRTANNFHTCERALFTQSLPE